MLSTESGLSCASTSGTGVKGLGAGGVEPGGRSAALLFSAGLLALLAITLAACSSNSTSSATTADAVVHQSGTGSKTVASVVLPKKWAVTWRFNCTNPVTARPFALTAKEAGNSPIRVAGQTGLGGGGTKIYSQTGTFDFAITTTCSWSLSVGPASAAPKTTTTTTTT
jgi:hypothetical protein